MFQWGRDAASRLAGEIKMRRPALAARPGLSLQFSGQSRGRLGGRATPRKEAGALLFVFFDAGAPGLGGGDDFLGELTRNEIIVRHLHGECAAALCH